MQAASNRTFICSVVFLDIVGYSRKHVLEQIQLKERLNALLTEAMANVAVNDRIILDTGDGAALSFLGDPEDALFVSLTMRDALATPEPHGPKLTLRLGINLGPVKLIKDINGQPNIIGDGINVAQRVMSFSEPGQVLVSRSYYEVVSCLSAEYVKLFHYEGSRTDKHVREHEVYAVQGTGGILQRVADAAPRKKVDTQGGPTVFDRLSQTTSIVTDNLRRKPRLGTALAVIAILAIAVGLRAGRQTPDARVAEPEPQSSEEVAVAPPPISTQETPPAPVSKKTSPVPPKRVVVTPKMPSAAPAREQPAYEESAEPATPQEPAIVAFAISPWGEVYIDGRKRGIAPPLRNVEVSPGQHRIEIRNSDFTPYVEIVEAKTGGRIRIRHKFR